MTLIELMVVVVIATILISIAIPSYQTQVLRSRRVEAKTALLDLAAREQRYYSTSFTGANYSPAPTDLGYPIGSAWPLPVADNYYAVTVCTVGAAACPPSPQTAPGFLVSAAPINSQTADTQCAFFAVDSVGRQWANDSNNNDTTTICWNN
jgi:type IV pilus assembly protein PilE